ncbi:MAG: chemotaxis protein methyltransferase CheR [Alphaproteobacteria bacterium]
MSLLEAARQRRQEISKVAGSEKKTLSDHEFEKFSKFIYTICGIRFQISKNYFLSSKLQKRYEDLGLKGFDEYFNFLNTASAKQTENHKLMDEITINETFFFRNQPQLEIFEKEFLIPLIRKRKAEGKNKIRLWSCASSTGDEAYTMALQILNLAEARGMQFKIIGTDICRDAIEKAKKAEYRKYGIRNIPTNMLAQNFTTSTDGHTHTLKQDIRNMVKFQECNLMDADRIRMIGKFDFAFCRNVLIYFDDASKEVALRNIYNSIVEDGFLIAGHSENLYSQRHIFKSLKEHSQAHAYAKAPPGTEKSRL